MSRVALPPRVGRTRRGLRHRRAVRVERLFANELPVGAVSERNWLGEPAHRREPVWFELGRAFLQASGELGRRALEGKKDETDTDRDRKRLQARYCQIEPRVLPLPRHSNQPARIVVFPAVARAADASIDTERESRGRVAVDQPRPAMPADVREAAHLPVAATQQQGGPPRKSKRMAVPCAGRSAT